MKILVVSEEVRSRPKEGLQVFLYHLLRHLSTLGDVFVAYSYGECPEGCQSEKIVSRKVLFTPAFFLKLRKVDFDLIFYIPSSGITPFGLLRGNMIKTISRKPTILIALQERRVGILHKLFSLLTPPDRILTPHRDIMYKLKKMGLEASFVMPGYDDSMFNPVDAETKLKLRKKLNLPTDRFILLHVGHIRSSRNIELFLSYRKWGDDIQPVIKAGEVETSWLGRLRMTGVIIIDEYMENINELYQAADCYFFPVVSATGAVEFPLSVMEAAACNLPILSTRFGVLEEFFAEKNGFYYFDDPSQIGEKISLIRENIADVDTRTQAQNYTWQSVFNRYLDPIALETAGEGSDG